MSGNELPLAGVWKMAGRCRARDGSKGSLSTGVWVAMLSILLTACTSSQTHVTHPVGPQALVDYVDLGPVPSEAISEASGLVASRRNRDVLWTHNDAGHPNRIYALSTSNRYLGAYEVEGCPRGDWEDIAAGPGPLQGVDYLYIANIGDNRATRSERIVCRIPEPVVDASQPPVQRSLTGADVIRFRYPDGPRDAETLLVDPQTRDIYVVSKRESEVRVYQASYPQSTGGLQTLTSVRALPLRYVVAGDISQGGEKLLLKTYTAVFLWTRARGQPWAEVLAAPPARLPYRLQLADEAIAWSTDGSGYFTLGENVLGVRGRLRFHPIDRH